MKVITNPVNTKIKFGVSEQILEVKGLKTNISGQSMDWKLSEKEDKKNKVQSITDQSTEVEYPSAKAVYEALQNIPGGEQIQSDWTQTDDTQVDFIKHKPSLATVATSGSYTDLSDRPTKVSQFTNDEDYLQTDRGYEYFWHRADWNESDTGKLSYILNKPTIPASPVQSNWNESDSSSLAYIQNKPTIPAAPVNADWNSSSGLSEILNKPTIPVVAQSIASGDTGYTTGDQVYQVIGNVESLLLALRGNV